uniref:Uncharacterized protein n=1 Tax=Parascaris univalens TaxID=6257 RepID=A0A915BEQ6_PARUN
MSIIHMQLGCNCNTIKCLQKKPIRCRNSMKMRKKSVSSDNLSNQERQHMDQPFSHTDTPVMGINEQEEPIQQLPTKSSPTQELIISKVLLSAYTK